MHSFNPNLNESAWSGDVARTKGHLPWGLVVLCGLLSLRIPLLLAGEYLHTWGRSDARAEAMPVLSAPVVAVDGGSRHSVALLSDGTVVAWGDNSRSQTDVPPNLANVASIACGDDHTVALGTDGRVRTWGRAGSRGAFPVQISDAVAIAASGGISAVLQSNGELSMWDAGRNWFFRLASDVRDVRALVMDSHITWALFRDGRVLGWDRSRRDRPIVLNALEGAVALAAGERHLVALMPNGRVKLVRTDGFVRRSLTPSLAVPNGLEGVRAIAAGSEHSLALLEDNTVVAWGFNDERQVVVPRGLTSVTALGAGVAHSIVGVSSDKPLILGLDPRTPVEVGRDFRLEATVLAEGAQLQWRLDGEIVEGATDETLLIEDAGLDVAGIYTLEVREASGAVVTASSQVYLRLNAADQEISGRLLCLGRTSLCTRMNALSLNGVVEAVSGLEFALARLRDGRVFEWRPRVRGNPLIQGFAPLDPISSLDGIVTDLTDVVQVAAGSHHRLALTADGRVVAWGRSEQGAASVPEDLSSVRAIAAGETHSLALLRDGTVVAWGSNTSGEANVPADLRDVTAVSAGVGFSAALKRDGTVVVWGDQDLGVTRVPERVANAVAIAAGGFHIQALMADGSVVTWGVRHAGGEWIPEDRTDVVGIASGLRHSVTVHEDGSIRHWGTMRLPSSSIPPGYEVVSVSAGRDMTSVVLVPELPMLSELPTQVTLVDGQRLVIEPEVTGRGPLFFQWFREGTWFHSSTEPVLDVPDMRVADTGTFEVYVVDGDGDQSRAEINVIVTQNDPGREPAGGIWAWGASGAGQLDVPRDLPAVTSVAAGRWHGLALLGDGMVAGWGDDRYGQATSPDGLMNVVAIAAGEGHSLALTESGEVWAWGDDRVGQLDVPENMPPGVAIAAGGLHNLVLHADGSVTGFGSNPHQASTIPKDLPPVAHIAAGERHSLAVTVDGAVRAWGRNRFGQTDVPDDLPPARSVVGGDDFSAALLVDGTVRVWGAEEIVAQTEALTLVGVTELSAGSDFLLARLADGRVIAWGGDSEAVQSVPSGLQRGVRLAAGQEFGLAIVMPERPAVRQSPRNLTVLEGHRATFSINAVGKAPLTFQWFRNGSLLPMQTGSELVLENLSSDASGEYVVTTTDRDGGVSEASAELIVRPRPAPPIVRPGRLVTWGMDTPIVSDAPDEDGLYLDVVAGGFLAAARRVDGELLIWGHEGIPRVADQIPNRLSGIDGVAVGRSHVVVIHRDGTVSAFGDDRFGETVVPAGLFGVTQVAAGQAHSMALREDGHVIAWGSDSRSQSRVPEGIDSVVAIAAGDNFSAAVQANGTLVTWGLFSPSSVPRVFSDAGLIDISAGSMHVLGLRNDGTVLAWGNNTENQLDVPSGLDQVVAVAAAGTHSMALRADGTIVTWGHNPFGADDVPGDVENVIRLAAGRGASVAVMIDPISPAAVGSLRLEAGLDARDRDKTLRLTFLGLDGQRLSLLSQDGFVMESTTQLGEAAMWQQVVVRWHEGFAWIDRFDGEPVRFFRLRRP